MSVVTVYTVFKDADEANAAARTLVAEKLAACVNLLGSCRSTYAWEGKIETTVESPALIKTDDKKIEAIIARLKELHSYENPAIAVWPIIAVTEAYASWVEDYVS